MIEIYCDFCKKKIITFSPYVKTSTGETCMDCYLNEIKEMERRLKNIEEEKDNDM